MVCAPTFSTPRCSFDIRTLADAPIKDIHTFIGTFTIHTPRAHSVDDVPMVQVPAVEPLSAENVLWSNTVLAAGSAVGFIVYTGSETRAVMNTSHPETKVGLLDLEINRLAKVGMYVLVLRGTFMTVYLQILCAVTFALSFGLVALNGFRGQWYIYVFRFLILFSSIIPIRYVFLFFTENEHIPIVFSSLYRFSHVSCSRQT